MAAKRSMLLEDKVEAFLEWPMVFLTILLIPIFAIPAMYTLSPLQARLIQFADTAILAAFYFELFAKFAVSKNYLRTLKRNWFLAIILVLPTLRLFRLARFARFLRIIRLLRLQSIVNRLRKNIRTLIHNLEYAVATLLVIVLIASFIMWQLEINSGGDIDTFGKAVWWSVITVTTVGYGDLVPTSPASQVFGGLISFVGIILFMVVIAKITSLFVKSSIDHMQSRSIQRLSKRVKKLEKKH